MEQLPKIAQQRLRAKAAGEHPDPDLLAAFAEKSLQERERAQVLQHLAQCADCRRVLSLALPELTEPSVIRVRSHWVSWPVLRWGALAACVVVVTSAVTLHYEQRQRAEPMVAERLPSPVSPGDTRLENRAPSSSNEKLAAKIPPASPSSSGGDLVVAGKWTKPGKDSGGSSATGEPAINGFETGSLQKQQAGNTPTAPRAGEARIDRLTDNQLAKADARTSTDQASPPAIGQFSDAAPRPAAPPSASKSKPANAEEVTAQRKETPDGAARGSRETVTVEAEAASVETAPAESAKALARGKDEADKKTVKTAGAGLKGSVQSSRSLQSASALNQPKPSWSLSPDGALQRSYDSGRTWETIRVASRVVFRALSSNDSDVWVGGASGVLYHSSDAGQHWVQVRPAVDGEALTADIVTVEFDDAQHGRLVTDNRDTWITSDGGASWHRR